MELVKVEQTEQEIDTWEAFWMMYPRHVAKKDAREAWKKISRERHTEILTALASWRRIWMDRGEMNFVPYPATWLNGERWEDEIPQEYRVVRPAQPNPQSMGEVMKRDMPEHVRALIAKLKGGK